MQNIPQKHRFSVPQKILTWLKTITKKGAFLSGNPEKTLKYLKKSKLNVENSLLLLLLFGIHSAQR